MSIYARPTKKLALLTIAVLVFAAATTFFIAFELAQECGRHAAHQEAKNG